MKVVVIGGSGHVGRLLVAELEREGHEALAASRSTGVDAVSGQGVAEALAGADAVIDVTNAPTMDPQGLYDFFTESTRTVAAAGVAAGVKHHVLLSIVGIEKGPINPYYVAKLAQEAELAKSGIPFTIVRATQFFDYAFDVADWNTIDGVVTLSDTPFQPVAVEDVVAELAARASAEPVNGIVEIAGPDIEPLDEFVRVTLAAASDPRTVVTSPDADTFSIEGLEGAMLPDAGTIGPSTWADWIARGPKGRA